MTEEIIIDGVNVAGCKYYLFRDKEPTSDRTCGIGLVACVGKECDYKIILRLKQENEKLKKEVKYWQSDVINDIKQYRSALEEIREIASPHCSQCVEILDKINGVLNLS